MGERFDEQQMKQVAELVEGQVNTQLRNTKLLTGGSLVLLISANFALFKWVEGNIHHEPAVPGHVVDPTGAGDIFFAAYLAKRLENASVGAAAGFAANFTTSRLREHQKVGGK